MRDYTTLAQDIIKYEPEFKPGGFVFKHISSNRSDLLVSIKSAVDLKSDLYDLERDDIGQVSDVILTILTSK
jgi:hypothetical protein